MDRLIFGIAGVPRKVKKNDLVAGLKELHKMDIKAMELEFVHGVRIKEDKARDIYYTAQDMGMVLTAHGPYYINLNAKEQDKIDSSIERIVLTAKTASMCGATSITFHAAYYMKDDPRDVYDMVSRHLDVVEEQLKASHLEILIRPEITGRNSQFGTLEELIALTNSHKYIAPCLDFGQLHARNRECNDYDSFMRVFEQLDTEIKDSKRKWVHIHASGVEYNSKGEVKKVNLDESPFNYEALMQALAVSKAKGVLVCESPNGTEDALMLRELYYKYSK